jgi:hypothetical protein
MRPKRLLEAGALLRRAAVPAVEAPLRGQDSIDRGRADRDDVTVEHHERQPPIPLERELALEVEDGLALLLGDPVIARNERVVLVGLPVALPPVVELALGDTNPAQEADHGDLRGRSPLVDEVDDGIAGVVGNPGAV